MQHFVPEEIESGCFRNKLSKLVCNKIQKAFCISAKKKSLSRIERGRLQMSMGRCDTTDGMTVEVQFLTDNFRACNTSDHHLEILLSGPQDGCCLGSKPRSCKSSNKVATSMPTSHTKSPRSGIHPTSVWSVIIVWQSAAWNRQKSPSHKMYWRWPRSVNTWHSSTWSLSWDQFLQLSLTNLYPATILTFSFLLSFYDPVVSSGSCSDMLWADVAYCFLFACQRLLMHESCFIIKIWIAPGSDQKGLRAFQS